MTHSATRWVILFEMVNGTSMGNAEQVTVDQLACLSYHIAYLPAVVFIIQHELEAEQTSDLLLAKASFAA